MLSRGCDVSSISSWSEMKRVWRMQGGDLNGAKDVLNCGRQRLTMVRIRKSLLRQPRDDQCFNGQRNQACSVP